MDEFHTIYVSGCFHFTIVCWTVVVAFAIVLIVRAVCLVVRGRRLGMMQKFGYWRRWGSLLLLVLAGIYIVWGGIPSPAFRLSKLKGMTELQVVARFGKPSDTGYAVPPGTSGGMTYIYEDQLRWPGFEYGVVFGKNGRVKYVTIGSK